MLSVNYLILVWNQNIVHLLELLGKLDDILRDAERFETSHLDRTLSRAQLAEAQRLVRKLGPTVIGADLAGA